MKIAAKRIRACVGALSAALMSAACVAEHSSPTPVPATAKKTQRGTAPPANSVRYEDLLGAVIEIKVPADTWAIVRFDETLVREGNQAFFIVATDPEPGAEPWYGTGSSLFDQNDPDRPVSTPDFIIRGLASEKRIHARHGYTFSLDYDSLDVELAFAVGSRFAPATFYLAGDVPFTLSGTPITESPPESIPVDLLALRPRVSVNVDVGLGGFGGIYLQSTATDGEPLEIIAGALRASRAPLFPTPVDVVQARTLEVSGQETFQGRGITTYEARIADQLGIHKFDYRLHTANTSRAGTGAGVSSIYMPSYRVQLPDEIVQETQIEEAVVNQAVANYALIADSGSASFEFIHFFAGREGRETFPPRVVPLQQFVPILYLISWGYIPVDFNEAFGWKLPTTGGQ